MSAKDEDSLDGILLCLQTARIDIVPTGKNRETRARYGITVLEQESIIRELDKNNYISGPLIDRDRPNDSKLFVFKKTYKNLMFYVKIKLCVNDEENHITCLSCHIDYIDVNSH